MYRVLEVTTVTGCKVGCLYCPQHKFAKAHSQASRRVRLDLDVFRKCLSTVPNDVDISFAGYAEPWLNSECTDMVEHASERGHGLRIFSTLVGMSVGDMSRLAKLDVKLFVVHLFDSGQFMRTRYVDDEYLYKLTFLVQLKIPKIRFLLFGELHPEIKRIVPPEAIVTSRPLISRASNVDPNVVHQPSTVSGALRCVESREYRNVLLPNGDVTLCCMDYERRHVIGNLLCSTYDELHNGEEFQNILRMMNGANGFLICRHCEYAARK